METQNLPVYGTRNRSFAQAVHFDNFDPSDYVIIDLRHASDHEQKHLPNALHIGEYDKLIEAIHQHAGKKILLQCYSGHTASQLGNDLVLQGYENIYFLDEVLEDFFKE